MAKRHDLKVPLPKEETPRPSLVPTDPAKENKLGGFFEERLRLSVFNYSIPKHANSMWYALGGATFTLLVLLMITGPLMTQYFNPSVGQAHKSILYIINTANLGWFIRGIHHWAAQLILVALMLHMGRVIVTGSYKRPREITYFVGITLMFFMFLMIFTGTMIKWDQEGFEALAHFAAIGKIFGYFGRVFMPSFTSSTHLLSRVYALHISILPAIIGIFIVVHFYLIKVLKISPLPGKEKEKQEETSTYTEHMKLLLKVSLGVTAVVMLLALVFGPPFGAEPVQMETGVKPPWMFLWLYALENVVGIPGIIYGMGGLFVALLLFPFIDRGEERRLRKRLPVMILLGVIFVTLIALSIAGYVSPPQIHSM